MERWKAEHCSQKEMNGDAMNIELCPSVIMPPGDHAEHARMTFHLRPSRLRDPYSSFPSPLTSLSKLFLVSTDMEATAPFTSKAL